MTDRRQHLRTPVNRGATIAAPHLSAPVECTVLNLSATGAMLDFAHERQIPDSFTLIFAAEEGDLWHPCRRVWQTENLVGIVFATPILDESFLARWRRDVP